MGRIDTRTIDIPLGELSKVETLFFRQIGMPKEMALKKFGKQCEETKETFYSGVNAEGILRSFAIEKIEEDTIHIEEGTEIESRMLSEIFKNSDELVVAAVTLHGYDELEHAADGGMERLFIDAWGTAAVELANAWMRDQLKKEVAEDKQYLTYSWSPGQHNVDIDLQTTLFSLLNPEQINIELTDSMMMHPKKSMSGFMGMGSDENNETIRACDFCEKRETCPTAYA